MQNPGQELPWRIHLFQGERTALSSATDGCLAFRSTTPSVHTQRAVSSSPLSCYQLLNWISRPRREPAWDNTSNRYLNTLCVSVKSSLDQRIGPANQSPNAQTTLDSTYFPVLSSQVNCVVQPIIYLLFFSSFTKIFIFIFFLWKHPAFWSILQFLKWGRCPDFVYVAETIFLGYVLTQWLGAWVGQVVKAAGHPSLENCYPLTWWIILWKRSL